MTTPWFKQRSTNSGPQGDCDKEISDVSEKTVPKFLESLQKTTVKAKIDPASITSNTRPGAFNKSVFWFEDCNI